ncbi:DNA gyrase inhibitor YacG [Alphaproteobacteria bacterium]|nr:DNA gyrase inhibitor YacG [Alphaproteobacteria bacterium]
MSAKITPLYPSKQKKSSCPLCKLPSVTPHTPFCSKRCAQLDLGKWLNEAYVISAHEVDEDADLESMLALADKEPPLS